MNDGDVKDCNSTALLIHTVLFAYEKSHGRMTGSGSMAILQFALDYLPDIMKELNFPELNREKSIEDNISSYILMIKESGYVRNAALRQAGDSSFIFEVQNCYFAPTGHKIFTGGYICPFAVLAASVISLKTGGNISMNESEFKENGSKTVINVKKKTASAHLNSKTV